MQIIYKTNTTKKWNAPIKVLLDGRLVGEIRVPSQLTFQYFPKGSKIGGEVFHSLFACQVSLEGDLTDGTGRQ
jgi:hypothetical protein